LDLFKGVRKVEPFLDFTWRRHKVILSNLANADTPNYRALDLEMRKGRRTIPLKTTNPKHIRPAEETRFRVIEINRRLIGNDRNNVSIEEEMAKIVQNRIAYEVYMRMVSGSLEKLNRVIRGGRR
jgi:flagellar basal-body rod protein FlgB